MEEKVITPSSSEGIHLLDNCKLLFCRFSSVRHLSFGTIQVKHLTLFRALLFQLLSMDKKGSVLDSSLWRKQLWVYQKQNFTT
uniref:Uncharacterized protein n=1 Tax=Solanum tuberosum TaxID=4113 RepID=M1CMX2_SOLTU